MALISPHPRGGGEGLCSSRLKDCRIHVSSSVVAAMLGKGNPQNKDEVVNLTACLATSSLPNIKCESSAHLKHQSVN